jgi:hypothetical protein
VFKACFLGPSIGSFKLCCDVWLSGLLYCKSVVQSLFVFEFSPSTPFSSDSNNLRLMFFRNKSQVLVLLSVSEPDRTFKRLSIVGLSNLLMSIRRMYLKVHVLFLLLVCVCWEFWLVIVLVFALQFCAWWTFCIWGGVHGEGKQTPVFILKGCAQFSL